MKTRRHSEAQVFRILKEVELGMPVVNAAREHGVSPATIHRLLAKQKFTLCNMMCIILRTEIVEE